MAVETELFLFLAARAQIVDEIVRPALKKGYVVVCDRFHDATVAYQGYGAGLDLKLIEEMGKLATKGIKPDLTVLLDVETKKGLRRAAAKDRIETKSLEFHKRVRGGYLALAEREPGRIKVIPTTEAKVSDVQDMVRRAVLSVV